MEDDTVEKVKTLLAKAEGKLQGQFGAVFEQISTLAREVENVKAQQRIIAMNEVQNIMNVGLIATELNCLHELLKDKYPEEYAEIQKTLSTLIPKDIK